MYIRKPKVERKLNIGGTSATDGWEVFNVNSDPYVDHVGNANDLSRFSDESFSLIYASHIVEHFDYAGELSFALLEWHRVLTPGGSVYISVPDLDVLASLFLDRKNLTADERYLVMRMIYGGHTDSYDYHLVGLNEEFLSGHLAQVGYVNTRRVSTLGFFRDTSELKFKDVSISLNMIADKPV